MRSVHKWYAAPEFITRMAFAGKTGYTAPMNKQVSLKTAAAAAFGAAAQTYDDAADLQRMVAGAVGQRIAALSLASNPRILEIGCGTGFLSRALADLAPGELVLSDIAPAMLVRCRDMLGDVPARFVMMDGEAPGAAGWNFDLVCSSLAFQWFTDLERALGRLSGLLAPGGHLVFSTLAEDSFCEWKAAHAALGLSPATRPYPSVAALAALLPGLVITEQRITRRYADGRDFLNHLKQIGAQAAEEEYRPLGTGALRRVLRRFEAGIDVTYHVAIGVYAA